MMLLRKIPVFLGFFSLSVTAYANLFIVNHTAGYSVLQSIKDHEYCSSTFSGESGIANPGRTAIMDTTHVRTLCENKSPCTIKIITSTSYENAWYCTGKTIGQATIKNLDKDVVKIDNVYDSSYKIVAQNSTITISK